jgi:hypothetical protein
VNAVPQTLEAAQLAGIDRYRAIVTHEWTHRHLAVLCETVNGKGSAGAQWERQTADRAGAQSDTAGEFLTQVLGLSYRDLHAAHKDAKDAGIRKGDDMARTRGWLPALEVAA